MKSMSQKNKILALLIAIIIIIGVIVILAVGFQFDLKYQEAKTIQLYLQKDFEISDIKQITDEMLPNQKVVLQKVEVYEDTVSILAKDITEEQKGNIVNKVNEKYGIALETDDIEITTIPHTRGRDIIKPYMIPFIIATAIILVYMAVRYYSLGMIKTIVKTGVTIVLAQAILISVVAITRIPIGKFTIPLVLMVYVLSLLGITACLEKKLKEKKEEE